MSSLPTIVICTAATRDDINLVWEAMGRGPNNISRKMCAIDPLATFETPPTHYMMQDMSATDTDVIIWQGLCSGDLPPISGVWGEEGIIEAATAQAACSGGNMQVYSAAGLETSQQATEWRDGTFLGVGLQFVPDEPI
jgi:hypothetical protein